MHNKQQFLTEYRVIGTIKKPLKKGHKQMMKKKYLILSTVLLSILVGMVILFLAEVSLRFFFPKDDQYRNQNAAYMYDSTLLIKLIPSIERFFVRDAIDGAQTIRWKTNLHGFRQGPLRKGVRRIMVYGDSNIQAVFSKDKDTYCSSLQEYIEELCVDSVEVINAGVVGYGPDQCFLRFSQDIEVYHPNDAVFVLFGHNDYGDIIRNRLFELDSLGHLVRTSNVRELDPLLQKKGLFDDLRLIDLVFALRKKIGLDRSLSHDEIRDKTITMYQDLCEGQFNNYILQRANLYSNFYDNYDIDVATCPSSYPAQVKRRLIEEVMRQITLVAEQNNIRLCFVILPSAVDVTKHRSISSIDLQQFPEYSPTNLTDPMVKIGHQLNVPTLDLFSMYSSENPDELYFSGEFNNHWTDYNQNISARKTAELICNGGN